MINNKPILESLDTDIVKEMVASPENIAKATKMAGVLGSSLISTAALAATTFGQDSKLPGKVADVFNFALTLEYLEDEFYRTGLSRSGLIPRDGQAVFAQISKHETAHVALLKSVLGSKAVAKPTFDFTAGGAFGDVFSNYQTFMALSQAFEDTGVRAYKGQAGNLKGQFLTNALQIHSVEARHAAQVRKMRGEKGWITGDSRGSLPAPTQPIYAGEGNPIQGGANLNGVAGLSNAAITEAFDEPLTKEQVLAIAKLFIKA